MYFYVFFTTLCYISSVMAVEMCVVVITTFALSVLLCRIDFWKRYGKMKVCSVARKILDAG